MTTTSGYTVAVAPGGAARAGSAETVDRWLAQIWAAASQGRERAGVALATVGSHARAEAGPHSDIDLVLLHDGRLPAKEIGALADRIWYPIWDAGVALDHSVRTLRECRAVATSDLPATVALLDLRLVVGDVELVAAARTAVAHDWRAEARRRLPELVTTVQERHARHGDLAHLLEPDLKEARGGLRDMSILRALTAAWLTDRPHGEVDAAYRMLLDVRDAVHLVTGRGRDRLHRQDQEEVAALLHRGDSRALMREVSDSARTIAHALDGTLRRASQSQRARTLRVGPRRPTMNAIGYGMFAHDGEAVLGSAINPAHDPLTTLRAAKVAATAGLPLAPATVVNLATKTPPLTEPWPLAARDLFCELLATGDALVPVWESLTLAGIVERWIPEWAGVRSLPQVSPVHRHTVDRHQVQSVVEANSLLSEVRRPDLLLVASLVHDLGKATRHGDHSVEGVALAERAVARMGFPENDVATIGLLVREHLTLAELATKNDTRDPATLASLLTAVKSDPDTLDLLYSLTVADAKAAGSRAWSDQRARLIRDLTEAARRLLWTQAKPKPLPVAPTLPEHVSAAVRDFGGLIAVEKRGTLQELVVAAPDRLGLFADVAGLIAVEGLNVVSAELATVEGVAYDVWSVDSPRGAAADPEVMTRHLRRIEKGDRTVFRSIPGGRPLRASVLVIPTPTNTAVTMLEVRAPDRVGLLRDIGTVFAQAGVSVHSAHIATYAGRCIDTFVVTEPDLTELTRERVSAVVARLEG